MGTPYISEIRIFSFGFAPKNWAQCNGQQLPINQNQALFSLLGTTYGGNGQTTFALPDLRGKVPIHTGSGFTQGQTGGEQSHTLSQTELPAHRHLSSATANSTTTNVPTGNVLSRANTTIYNAPSSLTALSPAAVSNVGGSQAHTNMQPYLVLNICIALSGAFPSQN